MEYAMGVPPIAYSVARYYFVAQERCDFDSEFLYWFDQEYYIFGFKINIIFKKKYMYLRYCTVYVYPIILYYF